MLRFLIPSVALMASIAAFGSASPAFAAGGATSGADLQISGSADQGSPIAGTRVQYTYQVRNTGPQGAPGATFTDQLPAGMHFVSAGVDIVPNACTSVDNGTNTVVTCQLGELLKSEQATVTVVVLAPQTPGAVPNTGTVSSLLTDPQPSNNSSTVSLRVQPLPTCTPPAGTTLSGVVMQKYTNSFGLFEDFQLYVNGVTYYVKTNFYDGTQPLTSIINLLCKPVNTTFIGGGDTVRVTGTNTGITITLPGTTMPLPVIDAREVETPFLFDTAIG